MIKLKRSQYSLKNSDPQSKTQFWNFDKLMYNFLIANQIYSFPIRLKTCQVSIEESDL